MSPISTADSVKGRNDAFNAPLSAEHHLCEFLADGNCSGCKLVVLSNEVRECPGPVDLSLRSGLLLLLGELLSRSGCSFLRLLTLEGCSLGEEFLTLGRASLASCTGHVDHFLADVSCRVKHGTKTAQASACYGISPALDGYCYIFTANSFIYNTRFHDKDLLLWSPFLLSSYVISSSESRLMTTCKSGRTYLSCPLHFSYGLGTVNGCITRKATLEKSRLYHLLSKIEVLLLM